ncbi:MAG: hypothetical protein WAW80_05040 [Candidatus Saccharimonadales bacterium]
MIKSIKRILSAALVVPVLALSVGLFVQPVPAHAAFDKGLSEGATSAQGKDQTGDAASLFGDNGQGGVFRTVTNVMLFLIGAVSVIMLIFGGIRYVVSGGDSTQVTNAKNTILYAVVGIVVAILAYAVVNFVIGSFSGTSS